MLHKLNKIKYWPSLLIVAIVLPFLLWALEVAREFYVFWRTGLCGNGALVVTDGSSLSACSLGDFFKDVTVGVPFLLIFLTIWVGGLVPSAIFGLVASFIPKSKPQLKRACYGLAWVLLVAFVAYIIVIAGATMVHRNY